MSLYGFSAISTGMKFLMTLVWMMIAYWGVLPAVFAQEGSETGVAVGSGKKVDKRVFGKSSQESFKGKVVVIKVGEKDMMNGHAFKFWRRVIDRVNKEKAKAVVFDLDTPGGLAFDTAELIMVDMQKLEVPSFSFVNQKALSAGALVASGTDKIYMHPISTIGAAAVVAGNGAEIPDQMRAKIESAFNAFVRAVSKSKGRNPDVIRSMMISDEYYDFGEVEVDRGDLLTLTADEAIIEFEGKPLLADGIVSSLDELLEKEGLSDADVIEAKLVGMEKFAYWAAAYSSILILVGLAGGYLEMKTPGFGLGGGIALLAFGLFFFGNYAAGNMAGYGLMLLFILGVVLVVVELFILPGMMVPGIVGGLLIIGTLFASMIDGFAFSDNAVRGWDSSQAWEFVSQPLFNLSIAILGSLVVMLLMMRFLPNIPLFNSLIMKKKLNSGDANGMEDSSSAAVPNTKHQGLRGVATTDLRPSGKGEFKGEVLDVTAAQGFIESGQGLVVVSEDGVRIIVESVEE